MARFRRTRGLVAILAIGGLLTQSAMAAASLCCLPVAPASVESEPAGHGAGCPSMAQGAPEAEGPRRQALEVPLPETPPFCPHAECTACIVAETSESSAALQPRGAAEEWRVIADLPQPDLAVAVLSWPPPAGTATFIRTPRPADVRPADGSALYLITERLRL